MSLPRDAVWLITGCSTGFGRALARQTLERGYRVVVTARDPAQLQDLVAAYPNQALPLKLDVTKPADITAAIAAIQKRFGQIDVLVNNAGIGYLGAVEESEDHAVRDMFEINFWGLANVTRAVLPGMRQRRAGHIVNISSIGGIRGGPGVGYYNATKFAVEGLSEALAKEVEPLGLKVLLVEPSGFRTDWAGRSASEVKHPIDDYAKTAGARRQQIRNASGKQAGDPERAASAIIDAVTAATPPFRLLLGKVALSAGREKAAQLAREFEAWATTSQNADFPEA